MHNKQSDHDRAHLIFTFDIFKLKFDFLTKNCVTYFKSLNFTKKKTLAFSFRINAMGLFQPYI